MGINKSSIPILHIIPSFAPAWIYGGAIQSVYQLCLKLAQNDCQVQVLTTNSNGLGRELSVEFNRDLQLTTGLTVRYCRRLFRHSISLDFLKVLPAYLRRARVVHLTGVYSFPTFPSLYLCKRWDIPVVWSPRGALQQWAGSRRVGLKSAWVAFCKIVLPKNLILHVTSEAEASESGQKLPNVPTIVIPNGVEIPDLINHISQNGFLRLLYLGRLDPKKGIENLLIACEKIKKVYKHSFKLTIAGEGSESYTHSLKNLVKERGLFHQVHFVGHIDNDQKKSLFAQIDVTVVPSYTENFGIVVAESLAHAVPVIASKGTPWQRVEEIGCGFWVDNDSDTLAKALDDVSRMDLVEMGNCGRLWMEREFSLSYVANRMSEVYDNICTLQTKRAESI